ncbi:hypothetical protein [Glaciecola sp. 33A]|jgi:hypothetical protein|uniref:hypothetical protein n=1 Tax=Glaciecola sp. 33A TaxID=2057807 RepID=UPI0012FF4D50|nr:hypothetical protein [Glaciecola sp. 33A]
MLAIPIEPANNKNNAPTPAGGAKPASMLLALISKVALRPVPTRPTPINKTSAVRAAVSRRVTGPPQDKRRPDYLNFVQGHRKNR